MSKNRFSKSNKKDRSIFLRLILPILIFIIVVFLFVNQMGSMAENSREQQYEALSNALRKSIIHNYASEGYYPPSLEYIINKYQITFNSDLFHISYRPSGSNIMPDFTIIRREAMR